MKLVIVKNVYLWICEFLKSNSYIFFPFLGLSDRITPVHFWSLQGRLQLLAIALPSCNRAFCSLF